MGLNWVRLDSNLPRNHKVVDLISVKDGYRSAFVYVCLLAYCGEQGTDGFIPRHALPFVHARVSDMDRLVKVALIARDPDGGGWNIPDWREFQPTNAEAEAKRERMRNASQIRWAKYHETQRKRQRSASPDA